MTIWTDYDEPYGRVLPFRNDFAPPRARPLLEEARLIIESSPTHAKAVAEGRSRRIVSEPPDASSKPAASATKPRIDGKIPEPWLRAVVTPPLLKSQERAESNSTNGRMHKLIGDD